MLSTRSMSLALLGLALVLVAAGCKTNPNKATVLETHVEKTTTVSDSERVGVNGDEEMVYQKKLSLAEEIRKLQNSVVDTEDRVYGTRAYGTKGVLGKYRLCYQKLPSDKLAQFVAPEGNDRISERDEDLKVGIDAKENKLSALSEEKLMDRIQRLSAYRKTLQGREDTWTEGLERCRLLTKE